MLNAEMPCVHSQGHELIEASPGSTFCVHCGLAVQRPAYRPSPSRRARKRANQDSKSTRQIKALVELYGDLCFFCRRPFVEQALRTRDHLVPRSRGGTDDLENLRLACRECNTRKDSKIWVTAGTFLWWEVEEPSMRLKPILFDWLPHLAPTVAEARLDLPTAGPPLVPEHRESLRRLRRPTDPQSP